MTILQQFQVFLMILLFTAFPLVTWGLQMEHFLAVKFAMGYEKNMAFLVIAKSPKVWKKLKR